MAITINLKLEARLRERADAEGLSVAEYVECLAGADQAAENELEGIALEGLNSGEAMRLDPAFGRRSTAGWMNA